MSTLLAVFETSGIIDTIMSVIGTLLYPLFSIIFVLIAGIQHVFFAFAGIDKASFNGKTVENANSGADDDTGIVYYLLRNEIIKNLFMSIMLLALFLVIIFTVMAFIKNVYSAKPKGWKEIVGNAIKGLANFIFLPVCCLLGVWLGNILLQAINGATSYKGATSMERKLFIACSYNANLFRCDETPDITWGELKALANNTMISDSSKTFAQYHNLNFNSNDSALVITAASTDEDRRYYAELVDQIFSETNVNLNWYGGNLDISGTYYDEFGNPIQIEIDGYNGVANFYSLWQINYLVLIVGGIFMLYVLGSLAFAMVRRLFLILVLFIVSPGVCALYPLDEGKAVGSWKSKFIEQVLSAYGAVAGLNIFFSLVPLIDKISIFDGTSWWNGWGINDIVQIFILVVGLMVVKEFISLISSFVGGEDAYSKGSSLMKAAAKEVGGRTGKGITKTVSAFSKAKAVKDATGSGYMRSLFESTKDEGKEVLKTLTGGAIDIEGFKKARKEARKEGLEHPNKAEEEKIEKYNEECSNEAFRAARASAQAAITAAGGSRLSNEAMANVLRGIQDKEAKRRVAAMFASYNNSIITADATYSRVTTTIDKVLEAEDAVLVEDSRRKDAFGAQTDYTSSYTEARSAMGAVSGFRGKYENRKVGSTTVVYNADGTTNLSEVTDERLQQLKAAAEAPGAASSIKTAHEDALKTNRIIREYAEKVEKEKAALKQLKQAALNFASGLEKLAENYKGDTKAGLINASNDVKSAVNASGATVHTIKTAMDNARRDLTAIPRDGTEIINILNTGNR